MRRADHPRILLPALLSTALGTGLVLSVLELHSVPAGLGQEVAERLPASGVSNPVTAVLLNFRGYDTLLEVAVLLLALLGAWSLENGSPSPPARSAPPVQEMLTRLLAPLLMLVAGYLLWAGAGAPGGAFQAGSVLGAAGILMLLAGWRCRHLAAARRPLAVLGPALFLLVGWALLLLQGSFLHYPPTRAGLLILAIETAAMLSIGATLTALFLVVLSARERKP